MAKWREAVRFQVIDLTDPKDAAFVRPGHYWLIPPAPPEVDDGLPERHISMVGPFETHADARTDCLRWIDQVLTLPEMKEAA